MGWKYSNEQYHKYKDSMMESQKKYREKNKKDSAKHLLKLLYSYACEDRTPSQNQRDKLYYFIMGLRMTLKNETADFYIQKSKRLLDRNKIKE